MKKADSSESKEVLAYVENWMNKHPNIDNSSTLIQIAIAEFVLNRQGKTLFK